VFVDGLRLLGQDDKNGLERILRIRSRAEHPLTDAEHEPAVPPNQRRKGRLIRACDKTLQKLRVALFVYGEGVDALQNLREGNDSHGR
jgi:hypothetical protein